MLIGGVAVADMSVEGFDQNHRQSTGNSKVERERMTLIGDGTSARER
jgi:hypothetical protein